MDKWTILFRLRLVLIARDGSHDPGRGMKKMAPGNVQAEELGPSVVNTKWFLLPDHHVNWGSWKDACPSDSYAICFRSRELRRLS